MGALDEIVSRAECCVSDGMRDADEIIRESYELEYCDWFLWELLKECYSPSELVTLEVEESLIEYIKRQVGEDVQALIDDAVQAEEDMEEAENAYYDLCLDELDESLVGNREREVFADLCRVEHTTDNGHELYRFFDGLGYSVTWDETQHKFIA